MEIGRVCIKLAGRDAGKHCVIVDEREKFVLIDGQTRRRTCNPLHLEPTDKLVHIKKGASSVEVAAALGKIGIVVVERKTRAPKEQQKTAKPETKKQTAKKPVQKKKT